MSEFVKEVNYEQLKETIQNNKTVLVDFFATWCGPCKMLAPQLDKVAQNQSDAVVIKIDVDREEEATMQYQVQAIPTLVLIKDGKEVARKLGYMSSEDIQTFIKNN